MKIAAYEADNSATLCDVQVSPPYPELRKPIYRNLTYLAQQGVASTYRAYKLHQDPRGTYFYRFEREG